jgi:hypothetical protein
MKVLGLDSIRDATGDIVRNRIMTMGGARRWNRDLSRQANFDRVGATEGSIWIADARHENLVLTYRSGPNSEQLVGLRQPIDNGLVSGVYACQRSIVENEVYLDQQYDRTLGDPYGRLTYALLATPLSFLQRRRGVIVRAQLMGRNDAVFLPVLTKVRSVSYERRRRSCAN